jgi:signal transduction histidine kinase
VQGRAGQLVLRQESPGADPVCGHGERGVRIGGGEHDADGPGKPEQSGGQVEAVAVRQCSPAPIGLRIPPAPGTGTGEVLRTGKPFRIDTFADTPLADLATELEFAAGVAVPITVEGRVWGTLSSSSPDGPLPADIEDRLTPFAELAAAAIANAENKEKLTASRARVVATADETRRRLQRDVHDSAQQRLVHTIIILKLARNAIATGGNAAELVDEAPSNAERANSDLRDVVHGILPEALTRGGLSMGLESLVARFSLPIRLRTAVPRLPPDLETTAYFIVAEALANVIKHAYAQHAAVELAVDGDYLDIQIIDDGVGGADPRHGSGLTGLSDRVEVSNGSLAITSTAGNGTTLRARLPIQQES